MHIFIFDIAGSHCADSETTQFEVDGKTATLLFSIFLFERSIALPTGRPFHKENYFCQGLNIWDENTGDLRLIMDIVE